MRRRTQTFGSRIVKLVAALPTGRISDVLGRQILKSGTSVGANYREACRASSTRHFISTAAICLREADETDYWIDLIRDAELMSDERLHPLQKECNELIAILVTTINTAKQSSS